MVELQKLVLAAENKMIELVAAEKTKINGNRTLGAAGLQISPSLISQYNVSLGPIHFFFLKLYFKNQ